MDSLDAAARRGLRPLERAARAVDRLRAGLLRALGRHARPWIRDRGRRAALAGLLALGVALSGVLVAPFALALAGPLVFGVPHVVGDLRYLGLRAGLARHRVAAAVVALGTVGSMIDGPRASALATAALAVSVPGASGGGRLVRWLPRGVLVGLAVPLAVAATEAPKAAEAIFAHVHHLVSIAILLGLYRHAPVARLVLGAALTGVVGWLATGALDASLVRAFGSTSLPLDPARLVRSVALGREGALAVRVAAIFLVLQAFHYAIWLRIVPELDRPRTGPRGYAASVSALRAELSPAGLLLVALLTLAVPAAALVDPEWVRRHYLRITAFHGHFEWLAACAVALRGGRLPGPSRTAAGRDTVPA